jgi:hypothetical protein
VLLVTSRKVLRRSDVRAPNTLGPPAAVRADLGRELASTFCKGVGASFCLMQNRTLARFGGLMTASAYLFAAAMTLVIVWLVAEVSGQAVKR